MTLLFKVIEKEFTADNHCGDWTVKDCQVNKNERTGNKGL